jgi:TolB protein
MQKILTVFTALLGLAVTAPTVSAQGSARDIGVIDVAGANTIAISISGQGELATLARKAFGVHGRYSVRPSGGTFDLSFTSISPTQVRVDVRKGNAAVLSQTVSGSSTANALYRAADVAVKATSGLTGFFATKLAFVSNRSGHDEIYVGDLFLGEARSVTDQKSNVLSPRWSPDGSKLIYTSFFKSGFPDIYIIDLAARRWNAFVSFKGTNSGARFSPDGSRVAMVLSGGGNPDIYIAPAQGRGKPTKLTNSAGVKSSPCFSPDGSRIVYAGEPGPQLYVMSANGGAATRVTRSVSNYCAEPDWSRADPNKIVFTMGEGRRFQIAVLDLKTGQSKKVSNADFDAVEPAWLPDGRHVVYTARSPNSRRLSILDTETGKSRPLATVSSEKGSPWWP